MDNKYRTCLLHIDCDANLDCFFYIHNSSCEKVMFSQVSVCPQEEVYTPWVDTQGRHPTSFSDAFGRGRIPGTPLDPPMGSLAKQRFEFTESLRKVH